MNEKGDVYEIDNKVVRLAPSIYPRLSLVWRRKTAPTR
jgi:hypothetical protein